MPFTPPLRYPSHLDFFNRLGSYAWRCSRHQLCSGGCRETMGVSIGVGDLPGRAKRCLVLLSLAAWLSGCAEPPAQRLEQTRQLVDAARAAGAPDYTMEEWTKLEVAFDRAKEELVNQEKVLAIFRSYGKADEMLKHVAQDAERVRALASEKRVALKAAAEHTEREAMDLLVSAEELLARVSPARRRTVEKDIRNELGSLRDSLSDVRRLIEEGRFESAQSQAQMLKNKAVVVSGQLRKSVESARGRKT